MLLGDVHVAHFHLAAHLLNLPSVFRALLDGIEKILLIKYTCLPLCLVHLINGTGVF